MDIDQETAVRLEEKLDRLLETAPIIAALGEILIRRRTATNRTGIHPTTISKNDNIDKFEEVGHRRVFIEVGDVAVIKKHRRRK